MYLTQAPKIPSHTAVRGLLESKDGVRCCLAALKSNIRKSHIQKGSWNLYSVYMTWTRDVTGRTNKWLVQSHIWFYRKYTLIPQTTGIERKKFTEKLSSPVPPLLNEWEIDVPRWFIRSGRNKTPKTILLSHYLNEIVEVQKTQSTDRRIAQNVRTICRFMS